MSIFLWNTTLSNITKLWKKIQPECTYVIWLSTYVYYPYDFWRFLVYQNDTLQYYPTSRRNDMISYYRYWISPILLTEILSNCTRVILLGIRYWSGIGAVRDYYYFYYTGSKLSLSSVPYDTGTTILDY